MSETGLTSELDAIVGCFARKIAAWFQEVGAMPVAAPNDRSEARLPSEETFSVRRAHAMTLGLITATWAELVTLHGMDAIPRMREWFEMVYQPAVTRGDTEAAEVMDDARTWFETCVQRCRSDRGSHQ